MNGLIDAMMGGVVGVFISFLGMLLVPRLMYIRMIPTDCIHGPRCRLCLAERAVEKQNGG